MKRRNRDILARLLATTSIVAISLTAAPVVLDPDFGGATPVFADSGDSCFVAGTRVLMADGSERPIEAVRPGDLVRGGRGGINRVVAVEKPRLGGRQLFAFNGGHPFVTAEHPFLTMAGWKAIDPALTARENAALKVGALATGDLLTRARSASLHGGSDNLARDTEIQLSFEPLKELAAVTADPGITVYNLLLDGDHSYIADGYVVHNKSDDDGDDGGDDDGGDDDGGDDGGGDDGGGDDGGGDDGGDDGGGDDGGDDDGGDDDGGDDDGGDDDGDDDDGDDDDDDGDDDDDDGDDDDDDDDDGDDDDGDDDSGSGGDEFFPGDPGAADRDLTPEEESELIERGWQ